MNTLRLLASLLVLAAVTSCDDGSFNHAIPAGSGSIVIDNGTFTDIDVFIDGLLVAEANDGDQTFIDIAPGEYRMVLEEHGSGNRTFASDIDVLEGRLTVVSVLIDFASDDYVADIFFDN